MEKNTIVWSALEHEYEHKDPDWFWAIGIIAISIAVVSVISGNTLFALLVLLSAVILFMHAIKKPRMIQVEIHEQGILLDNTPFPYDILESFFIIEHKDKPRIILKSKKIFIPYIVVPLEEEKQTEIREYLLRHLPEQKLEIPLSHRIAEFIGL